MKVYKYRGGNPDSLQLHLDTLAKNQFWASRADQLNDPAEGFVDDRLVRSALSASGAREVLTRFDDVLAVRNKAGVFSLSRTPVDELLWSYYADGHRGFCIEYDLARLCLEARSAWNVVDVAYHNTPQTVTFDDLLGARDPMRVLVKMIGTGAVRPTLTSLRVGRVHWPSGDPNDANFLQTAPLPASRHSVRGVAVLPLHAEPA